MGYYDKDSWYDKGVQVGTRRRTSKLPSDIEVTKETRQLYQNVLKSPIIIVYFGIHVVSAALAMIVALNMLQLDLRAIGIDYPFIYKSLMLIVAIVALIIPILIGMVIVGASSDRKLMILKGLDGLSIYMKVVKVLLIIGAIGIGIFSLTLLFRAFLFVIIFVGIVGGFIYVYNKFLDKTIELLDSLASVFTPHYVFTGHNAPDPTTIRPYMILIVILQIIQFFTSFAEESIDWSILGADANTVMNTVDTLSVASNIISIVSTIVVLIMLPILQEKINAIHFGQYSKLQQIYNRKSTNYSTKDV